MNPVLPSAVGSVIRIGDTELYRLEENDMWYPVHAAWPIPDWALRNDIPIRVTVVTDAGA